MQRTNQCYTTLRQTEAPLRNNILNSPDRSEIRWRSPRLFNKPGKNIRSPVGRSRTSEARVYILGENSRDGIEKTIREWSREAPSFVRPVPSVQTSTKGVARIAALRNALLDAMDNDEHTGPVRESRTLFLAILGFGNGTVAEGLMRLLNKRLR